MTETERIVLWAYDAHREAATRTPRQRWGTCCPSDPECEHSFMDDEALTEWMDSPISDTAARALVGDVPVPRADLLARTAIGEKE